MQKHGERGISFTVPAVLAPQLQWPVLAKKSVNGTSADVHAVVVELTFSDFALKYFRTC